MTITTDRVGEAGSPWHPGVQDKHFEPPLLDLSNVRLLWVKHLH